MGHHIYIKNVVEKPPYNTEPDQTDIVFWPISDFTEFDWCQLESLFTDKVATLFQCEGLFLEDCDHETHQLPLMRVKATDQVFYRKDEFAAYIRQQELSNASQRLLDYFVEGLHIVTIM